MEASHIKGLKVLLLVSSLVCLVFLLLAAFEENFTAEWHVNTATAPSRVELVAVDPPDFHHIG